MRSFPLAVVLSAYTGVLLCPSFGDVHELCEHLAGGPLWTHEFASKKLFDRLSAALRKQHAWLAAVEVPAVPDVRGAPFLDRVRPWLSGLEAEHGHEVKVQGGTA